MYTRGHTLSFCRELATVSLWYRSSASSKACLSERFAVSTEKNSFFGDFFSPKLYNIIYTKFGVNRNPKNGC